MVVASNFTSISNFYCLQF